MKYNLEQTKDIIKSYKDGESVESIAERYGATKRSIIAKLVIEEVYIKPPTYITKTGEAPRNKSDIMESICDYMDWDILVFESLERCTKPVLRELERALVPKLTIEKWIRNRSGK